MTGNLSLKTAPATEPITLAEAKLHLKVDINADDALITSLITAARRWIEDITGIRMMTQTWNCYLDEFPEGDVINLPIGPVSALSSVKYTDSTGAVATFAPAGYVTDLVSLPARIVLVDGASWPTDTLREANGVDIEFVAGYGAAADMLTAQNALTAAQALAAAAITDEEIAAALAALVAAEALVTDAQAAQIAAIPEELRAAVKMLVAYWFENRAAGATAEFKELPLGLKALISGFRMWQR
jgi:uncharacterized phiE125 gp8 family phage protein